jgi:hypothetical protein
MQELEQTILIKIFKNALKVQQYALQASSLLGYDAISFYQVFLEFQRLILHLKH